MVDDIRESDATIRESEDGAVTVHVSSETATAVTLGDRDPNPRALAVSRFRSIQSRVCHARRAIGSGVHEDVLQPGGRINTSLTSPGTEPNHSRGVRDHADTMGIDVDAVAEAIRSGETDRVTETIERVSHPDGAERFAWYGELMDAVAPALEHEDGYVRLSAIRVLVDAYPDMEYRFADGDSTTVEGISLEDTTENRSRLIDVLLRSLDDPDGRVRKAAGRGINHLTAVIRVIEADAEMEALYDLLTATAVRQSEERRSHTEQALNAVDRPGVDAALAEFRQHLQDR